VITTWAVGDVQGCWKTLRALLRRLGYPRHSPRLWLAGDLVNRGPGSLEVLRWAADQGERVVAVLGNHDIHLLMVAAGLRAEKPGDTLERLLRARDRDELLAWLRARPLVHRDGRFVLVHGGLWPSWSPAEAVRLSAQASRLVESGEALSALAQIKGTPPWRPAKARLASTRSAGTRSVARSGALSPEQAATFIRLVTTLRLIDPRRGGHPVKYAGPPEAGPRGAMPWYAVPGRRSHHGVLVFGHWAAHGLTVRDRLIALDSGCVWGRALSAVCVSDPAGSRRVVQEPARDGTAED
jgi:bis(5'-nucleosyl)-tetraphosphatase (symmetrical)